MSLSTCSLVYDVLEFMALSPSILKIDALFIKVILYMPL